MLGAGGVGTGGLASVLTEDGPWFASMTLGAGAALHGIAVEHAVTAPNGCGGRSPVYSGTVEAIDSSVLANRTIIGAFAARHLVLRTPDPTPLWPQRLPSTCATTALHPDDV